MPRKPSKNLACPARYRPDDSGAAKLLRIVRSDRFEALQQSCGGTWLWIPKLGARPSCSTCRLRNRCILTWRGQSHSVTTISRHLGISPKTVYRVCEHPAQLRWTKTRRER